MKFQEIKGVAIDRREALKFRVGKLSVFKIIKTSDGITYNLQALIS